MIESSLKIENNPKKGKLEFLLKYIFVFGFIYDINFTFLPSLTSARICFLILLLTSIFNRKNIPRSVLSIMLIMLFILCVSLFQYSFSLDSTQVSRIIWFTLYGLIAPFLFTEWIKSKNEFLNLVTAAVAFQSILSILSFINPAVKSLFYSLIIYTSNYDEDLTLRAVGFASIGGASLSVIQSLGVITALILLKINDFKLYKTIQIWLSIILIVLSTILIGRTGLFISLLCIVIYFITEIRSIKNVLVFFLIVFLFYQIDAIEFLADATKNVNNFNVEMFTEWIETAFKVKGNDTTDALASMPIPPISTETILGTGKVVNSSGIGNASGHDSGYIQAYYSLGLLVAILFYISYLLFIVNHIKKVNNKYLYILVIVMYVIEIKEPFIFHYIVPFFVLSMILVWGKLKKSYLISNNN